MAPHVRDLRAALAAARPNMGSAPPAAVSLALAPLQSLMPAHLDYVLEHLRHEESEFSYVLKKNLANRSMREAINKVRRHCFQL